MENSIITTKKSAVKTIVSKLSESSRVAVDTLFAYAPQIEDAERKMHEAQLVTTPVLCDTMSKIAADKAGIKEAGYKTFTDLARAVFGFNGVSTDTISQWKRVGDLFFNVPKRPECATWYTVSMLHELRNVPIARLDEAAKAGRIKPTSTAKDLRDFAKEVEATMLEDGESKPEVIKTYTGVFLASGEKFEYLDESGIASGLNGGVLPSKDAVHVFKSKDKLIIPVKKDGAKPKEKPIYVMVVEADNGTMYSAKYREDVREKTMTEPDKPGMTNAQIDAMRAAGLSEEQISAIIKAK